MFLLYGYSYLRNNSKRKFIYGYTHLRVLTYLKIFLIYGYTHLRI